MKILVFEVAYRRCALPLGDIREVVRAAAIAPLPSAPPAVAGVIDVRGAVLPVFTLRSRFGLPDKDLEPSDRLVIASAGDRVVVLLVDDVTGVVHVEPQDMARIDDLAGVPDYVSGVARLPDGLVLIHDLRRFLAPGESAALDRLMAEAAAVQAGKP